jgi:FdhD protein
VSRSILTVPVSRIEDRSATTFQDLLAVEEPLEIRLGGQTVSITMRTPGNDFELAAGFLFTEGILTGRDQIGVISHTKNKTNPRQGGNSVSVELKADVEIDFNRLERHFYTSSSCGVCGKASIEALEVQGCPMLPRDGLLASAGVIHSLPDALRQQQAVFESTGGLHAAALFDVAGNLTCLREDVGRHNAVDKLIGAEFLAGRTPLAGRMVLVSGRTSFELVQKCLVAGIPLLAAVGAPSSLAVELARRFQMTLLGFVRDRRFNVYSGGWRIR